MANPDLINSGSTIYDSQRVYTDAGLAVGTVGLFNGRSYVWCSYTGSTALSIGEVLVASPRTEQENLACTTACLNIGQTVITGVTAGLSAITANQFQDGLMVVVDGGGEGNAYYIKTHSAFTASTADGSITLRDPIIVASDANTEVTLIRNKYANVQKARGGLRDPFVGIPNVAVPAGDTNTQYFWAQRTGLCPAFVKGTPRRGTSVIVSKDTPGSLAEATRKIDTSSNKSVYELDSTPVVGQMATDAIDGEIQIVDLQNPIF